jgi:hypothetical protein
MKNIKACFGFMLFLFAMVFVSCGKGTKANEKETGEIADQGMVTGVSLETDRRVLPDLAEEAASEKAVIEEHYMLKASVKEVLTDTRWYNAGSGKEMLRFYPDLTWTLTDFFGLGEFVQGSYTVTDDSTVILELSNMEYRNTLVDSNSAEKVISHVLGKDSDLSFILQRDYIDFYAVGRLYNAQFDKTFRSAVPSPENENYELDGIMVTKKSGQIIIEEIIPTKKSPFDNAEEFSMWFTNRFSSFSEYWQGADREINVVLPGEVFDYDALYKTEDNKLWYRIRIDNSMTYDEAWVCGDSVSENSDNSKSGSDYKRIRSALMELGYIETALIER